jgi:hypothetical protein
MDLYAEADATLHLIASLGPDQWSICGHDHSGWEAEVRFYRPTHLRDVSRLMVAARSRDDVVAHIKSIQQSALHILAERQPVEVAPATIHALRVLLYGGGVGAEEASKVMDLHDALERSLRADERRVAAVRAKTELTEAGHG